MDNAIEDYTKAIGLDPKVAVVYTARGEAYGKKGDWDPAFADYDKAIELDPKSTTCACAYKGRGAAYLAKGDTNHAIEDYTKAIDFDSQAIQRDAKSAALGMIAVGNVRLSANYKRHYRTATNHWICKRTMLIPATVALLST